MQKMKKSMRKRLKITGTGKMMKRRIGLGHFLAKRAKRRKTPRRVRVFPIPKST